MELHDVSYGLDCVAQPLLLFLLSENQLLWFRYREYDLAHLKLVFELDTAVLSLLDTVYWSLILCGLLVSGGTDTPYLLDGYGVLVFRTIADSARNQYACEASRTLIALMPVTRMTRLSAPGKG
ncbi:hypothetical protein Tco_0964752 [Tanacetum coccineum]